jgi:hypothetical protein
VAKTDRSLANPGVDIHVDADGLIRDNRERLRFRANMPACAALHIENVIPWWQRSTIVSVPVRSNPRDFFFFVAQDAQRT